MLETLDKEKISVQKRFNTRCAKILVLEAI